jgi:hypothetical protein
VSIAALGALLAALGGREQRHQRRIVATYLGLSTLLFGIGVALLVGSGTHYPAMQTTGVWLIGVAALVRKGIVPFHAWVPEVFDRGRLGPAILFNAPQVGAYITVVLIVPRASPAMLRTIAMLALVTAVYGAALALVQSSARRACGYLFVSQSALVMAGLDCTSASALAGGLVVWLSAGLAFAGLARSVLVLEARRGRRLDLNTYHGGYERMPVLAVSFLAMGLACTGFPGTLGFVGQELLVNGAVDTFPVLGFSVVVASALTGLAVVRMYFSLFCGRPDPLAHSGPRFELKQREVWSFITLVIVLIGFGVMPRPLVDSRFVASDDIFRLRQEHLRAAGFVHSVPERHETGRRAGDRAPEAREWRRVRGHRVYAHSSSNDKTGGIMATAGGVGESARSHAGGRPYHRDLAGSDTICTARLAAPIQYRSLDRRVAVSLLRSTVCRVCSYSSIAKACSAFMTSMVRCSISRTPSMFSRTTTPYFKSGFTAT